MIICTQGWVGKRTIIDFQFCSSGAMNSNKDQASIGHSRISLYSFISESTAYFGVRTSDDKNLDLVSRCPVEVLQGSTLDNQQWQAKSNSGSSNPANAVIKDGKLRLQYSNLPSKDFNGGNKGSFSGVKVQSKFQKLASTESDPEMPSYGYWEAKIKVAADREGRSCKLKLIPEDEWNLNPNGVIGDTSAKKGAKITIMSNEAWGKDSNKTWKSGVEYWKGDSGDAATVDQSHLHETKLSDDFHIYGLRWTSNTLQWYFDGKLAREETGDLVPQDVKLYWQLESSVVKWLNGGPKDSDDWSGDTACEIEYVRHYTENRVNDQCLPKDLAEKEKCEEFYSKLGSKSQFFDFCRSIKCINMHDDSQDGSLT